ncbi:MAG: tetratricopeptide repeat protein [bacterium]
MKKIKKNKIIIILIMLHLLILISINSFTPAAAAAAAAGAKTPKKETSPQAAAMYKKALKDYNEGNTSAAYDTVKYMLNNYAAGKTLSSDIYYLCGKILYGQGNFFTAKSYFQRIIYKNPDYKKIYNVIFYMARSDFNLKNHRRSIRDFDFLLKKTEKGSELYDKSLIYLTLSYASSEKMKEADKLYKKDHVKKILKKIIYLRKRNNYFKLVYLNYLINYKNNLSAALLILNNKNLFFLKKDDMCYKAYYEGIIALKEKKYPVAQDYFVKSSGYCSGYYYKSGLVYYGISLVKQKNLEGIKYIKNGAVEIGYPKIKFKSLKFLANFYQKENKPETELKYLKRLLFDFNSMPEKEKIAQEKKAAGLIYEIIKNDYKNNRLANAFKSLNRIEFLIPEQYMDPKTYLELSKIKLKEKNDKDARVFAEKYNNLSKSPASVYFLGHIYFKLANYKKSLALINGINLKNIKSLNLRNKIIKLKLRLYKKLNYNGNYVNLLKTSLNLLPPEDKFKNLYFLGRQEFDKNNLKAANMYFNLAIKNGYAAEKNNKNILYGTYYYLGLINYKFNNYKFSLMYFKKGYGLDASGKHFQYELSQIAYIYMKYMNNKTLALKYYGLLSRNAASATYKSLASSMISAINVQK